MNIVSLLITLIIAIIVLAFNPLSKFSPKNPITGVDKKTQNAVNQVQSEAEKQVNYAREMQRVEQEQSSADGQ